MAPGLVSLSVSRPQLSVSRPQLRRKCCIAFMIALPRYSSTAVLYSCPGTAVLQLYPDTHASLVTVFYPAQ